MRERDRGGRQREKDLCFIESGVVVMLSLSVGSVSKLATSASLSGEEE